MFLRLGWSYLMECSIYVLTKPQSYPWIRALRLTDFLWKRNLIELSKFGHRTPSPKVSSNELLNNFYVSNTLFHELLRLVSNLLLPRSQYIDRNVSRPSLARCCFSTLLKNKLFISDFFFFNITFIYFEAAQRLLEIWKWQNNE